MPTTTVFATAEAAEQAFYTALQRADLRALMAVWADDDTIVCVHPGSDRLLGLEAVRNSWAEILSNGGLNVRPRDPRVFDSATTSVRCVIEQVRIQTSSGARVAECQSINVFVQNGVGWRLVLHHASPGHSPERDSALQEAARHSGVLH